MPTASAGCPRARRTLAPAGVRAVAALTITLFTAAGCGGAGAASGHRGTPGGLPTSTPGASSPTSTSSSGTPIPPSTATTTPAAAASSTPPVPGPDATAIERKFWQAVQSAEATSDPTLPALLAVAEGDALAAVQRTIREYTAKGQVLRGPITPTGPKPAGVDQGGVVVKDCVDASANLAYERSTGRLVAGQPARNRFLATFLIGRTPAGVQVINDGFATINSC